MADQFEFHEAANIFPIDDEHLDELAKDIKANGQHVPIEILDGKIVDGRRRSMACRIAGVNPITREVSPEDPVQYVLSLNLHRRHLTPSQAAMCAARARDIYERQAKERQAENAKRVNSKVENFPPMETTTARDAAGKAFGVSGKSVDHAKRVIEKGIPALAKAVDEGRMAVSTAAILATEPEEAQKAEIANPNRNRRYKPGKGGGSEILSVQSSDILPPKHPGEHTKSELFAINKADVAITQLKGIPEGNDYRDAAFDRVTKWIQSQRKAK